MPVHRCTAMDRLSSRWEPIASASLHGQCALAEWCISRISCCALSLSPPIVSTIKNKKYAGVASRLGAELMNFSVDACGGMAGDASRLVRAIGEEGERWCAGTWTSATIERQLLGTVAMAVQRGNTLVMLSGFTKTATARAEQRLREKVEEDGEPGEGTE